ncbi:tRNA (adenosine(37)-N6)-dimethylallyltransferase MiaA [Rhabdochromatium marinum]|uniref:tRNA (adenosine(37)-N6)-dimethylallyltransferase MiaA n=1 Tax=Rhabdochromatium marinum TaxID=48729 RepID=UPI00190417A7|nr:tRNA (adenosine(37)-N6)-dimethylallyltransferase MiaA [Rhabdochromatium marinum]MBK1649164.1 tRNA (adenosine(37)-N6)-dimethylallyltransferase MiaA [Rhabdochromatium marinum]
MTQPNTFAATTPPQRHWPPAIFLMGPTAAGKTALALELAAHLDTEIISVDSALVYRGLDIGTAKPTAETLARVPHRLIDILDPAESYSAAQFRTDALAAMQEISAAGRIPLLVGGTMLYFRALTRGLAPLPAADPELRHDLARQNERLGSARLHRWLAVLDPAGAARIHPNDPQRIQRALEVYLTTGQTLSEHWAEAAAQALPYRVVKLVRADPAAGERQALRERIAQRFDAMLAAGFVREVTDLRARGDLQADLPSMRAVGYRQLWHYLDGDYDFNHMRALAITATRQLAKRQMTWLRSERDALWLPQGPELLERALLLVRTTAAL